MEGNRFQSVFLAYFLGLLFGNVLFQVLFLFALGALGILYLDKGEDHLFTGALSGFLNSGAVIFAFLVSFIVAHAYHGGRTFPRGAGIHFVAAVGVIAAANGFAFLAALLTREKEALIIGTFALSSILSLPVPWLLRTERTAPSE